MLVHGSWSCDEDRLGHPERPSVTQCRASHLKHRGGHTILLSIRRGPPCAGR
jgi:hypothetical protein